MKTITKEQEDFLNKCVYGSWKLNTKTGLVDVDRNFNCSRMGLSDFMGIEFGNISGSFDCSHNKLVSLYGSPKYVGVDFDCSNNELISLKGSPEKVGYSFYCSNNELISLKGSPEKVGYSFYSNNNKLVSLEGAPKEVGFDFLCSNNQLVSLEGAPQEVDYFDCSHNKLISLEGAPKKINRGFWCNPISLRDCPIDLLDKIYFFNNKKYFVLKDYITMIINGLDPEIYLKKMI